MNITNSKITIGGMSFKSMDEMREYAKKNKPSWYHEYSGATTIIQKNGSVIINEDVITNPGELFIYIEGDVEKVQTASGDVTVKGNCGKVQSASGDIHAEDILGNVNNMSGDVVAKSIAGKVSTMSGNISCK